MAMAFPPMAPIPGGPYSNNPFGSPTGFSGGPAGFPGGPAGFPGGLAGFPGRPSSGKPQEHGLDAALHKHDGPFQYERMQQGNCTPEYFSKLWEDEFKADLKEDATGMSLDHFRKFGLGHARVGGRVNLSPVEPPKDLIDKSMGDWTAYTDYRVTTRHLDGSDDPLKNIKQWFDIDPDKQHQKPVHLVAGGLEPIHLGAGDLKEEVKHEKQHEKQMGWLHHKEKKKLWHETARLESGAHLPPQGTVFRLVVPHLLRGQQLGLDIRGVIVDKITDKKAKQFGWKVGDQILKVNGRLVSNNLEFQERMEHAVAVLRTTNRPIVFEVWREELHAMAGSWAQTMGHRFAAPDNVVSEILGPSPHQVAAMEHENAMLMERLRQQQEQNRSFFDLSWLFGSSHGGATPPHGPPPPPHFHRGSGTPPLSFNTMASHGSLPPSPRLPPPVDSRWGMPSSEMPPPFFNSMASQPPPPFSNSMASQPSVFNSMASHGNLPAPGISFNAGYPSAESRMRIS